jgi:hypothetical protein
MVTFTLRGRARELADVESELDVARGGHARAFAFVGEPGIGKTRLVGELAARAETAGFVACWGRAWETGGAPAYWPWRGLVDALPGAAHAALGELRGRLARGASEPRARAASDPDQARFELFDAVARTIRAAAAVAPLACILDDVHAADLPSLELAVFAARELRACRIAWLFTWRDAEARRPHVRDAIARLAREARVLPLAPLSAADASALADDAAVGATPELRAAIVEATGGNPLFVIETLASLRLRGALPAELARLPLAEGVAAVVRERLALVSPAARSTLDAAALLGRELELARWCDAADAGADVVRRHADELAAAGLVVELDADRWQFGHDLVREAIARELGDDAARALHARIARALDARIAAGAVGLAGERAHHALSARAPEAIGWAIAAAEQARAERAYEEAVAIVERAVEVGGAIAAGAGALQLELGHARGDVGDVAGSRAAFLAALAAARRAGDPALAAEAVLGLGRRYVFGDVLDELIAFIDEVVAMLPADATVLRARLLARKAAALTPPARPAETLALANDALALVADARDPRARLEVAVAVGSAFAGFAHPRACIPVDQDVVHLARQLGDRTIELRGLSRLFVDYMLCGEFVRAGALLARRDDLARELVLPRFTWNGPLLRSMRAMADGELARCRDAIDEAAALADARDQNAARCLAMHRFSLLVLEDRADEMRASEAATLAALHSMDHVFTGSVRALVRLRCGEVAAARAEAAAIDRALPHAGTTTLTWIAEVAAEVGARELAIATRERLQAFADTWSGWGMFALTSGPPVAAYLGLLAAALGEPFAPHFDAALDATTTAGARAHRAWVRYWYGRARRDRAMLHDAAAEADALGMVGLVARCRAAAPATTSRASTPSPPPSTIAWTIAPHGEGWRIEHGGAAHLVADVRGMAMIARLRERADDEVHALELVSGDAAVADAGDAGELLDPRARAAYRARAVALADAVAAAEARGDVARAEQAQDELETLQRELARAIGKGGRARRAGAAAERARISAQRRIREAIRKIAQVDAALGVHLQRAIRTGTFCVYRSRAG